MLILTREVGEAITIGADIKITVLRVDGAQVRVGTDAPRGISVYREELLRPRDVAGDQTLIASPEFQFET